MTQVGEGRGAGSAGESMTFGAPAVGEILAERYQLEQHVNDDSSGRQIWRGVDVLLRRPVAVVMRYPGGLAARRILQAAVEASRIVHPNVVGVYDAIDEGFRAYVVREWVDGASLRDHIAADLFDSGRATTVAHAVAAAVTAVHSAEMTHGNIHPGTVLIGTDGRVVLSDPSADQAASPTEDVRAVGAVLYFALTGYWPHAEMDGPRGVPDAPRSPSGELASLRQVRAGVPEHLDALAMDLLDRRLTVPPASTLAQEFARIDAGGDESYHHPGPEPGPVTGELAAGPLRFRPEREDTPKPRSGRKIALGVGALLVIGLLGLVVGLNLFSGSPPDPAAGNGTEPGNAAAAGDGDATEPTPDSPEPIALSASQVRIVDPPPGDRTELRDVELVVDDDLSTGWRTQAYTQPAFGNLKPGMGILIDLGEPRHVSLVTVHLSTSGASAEMRTGERDPGNTSEGDEEIVESYRTVGEPFVRHDGTTMVFSGFDADEEYQYLLVWITEMPPDPESSGRYRIGVQQVSVEGY